MSSFNNKVAIVTGGGTGIGKAIAESFVQQSGRVLITGRRKEPLSELQQRYPDNIRYIQADVTNTEDQQRIVATAIEQFGKIDVLVNNAGLHLVAPFQETTDEQFAQSYQVNLVAPAALIREALPHLSKSNGSVINVSTIGARAIFPEISPYSTSKAALDHLTRVLAVELGPLGIRVNAVSPGMTRTDMAAPYIDDAITQITPLRRIGEPTDIADLVQFLASDDARWVTGQIIDASGGLRI